MKNIDFFSKIDWIFINRDLLDTMPDCKALFLLEGISDNFLENVMMTEEY